MHAAVAHVHAFDEGVMKGPLLWITRPHMQQNVCVPLRSATCDVLLRGATRDVCGDTEAPLNPSGPQDYEPPWQSNANQLSSGVGS
jgi:hypothetical protein